jgi:hypothetical protein
MTASKGKKGEIDSKSTPEVPIIGAKGGYFASALAMLTSPIFKKKTGTTASNF